MPDFIDVENFTVEQQQAFRDAIKTPWASGQNNLRATFFDELPIGEQIIVGIDVDGEFNQAIVIPYNEPGGVPRINEEGVIPARVSVLKGTLAEIGDVVLANGELAVERNDTGGLVGVRVGDGVADVESCPFAGDAWEKDDSSSMLVEYTPTDYVIYQTNLTTTSNQGRVLLEIQAAFEAQIPLGESSTASVGYADGTPIAGLSWLAIRIDGSSSQYPADGEMKSLNFGSGFGTYIQIIGHCMPITGTGKNIVVKVTNSQYIAITKRQFWKRR